MTYEAERCEPNCFSFHCVYLQTIRYNSRGEVSIEMTNGKENIFKKAMTIRRKVIRVQAMVTMLKGEPAVQAQK